MSNYAKVLSQTYNSRQTSQGQAIPGREQEMAKNNAGGYTFTVDPMTQLDRFLVLGTEGGTYYAGEKKLTKENATAIIALIKSNGVAVVNRVVEISDSGRAPKNDPALFVLALASAADDADTRKAALNALPKVARIGTHLFHYASFVEGFRGWGRSLRRAVANWYNEMPVDRLALQAIKYQQRDGWSHRDLLRLSHPSTTEASRDAIYRWIVGGIDEVGATERSYTRDGKKVVETRLDRTEDLHVQIAAFEQAKRANSVDEIVGLIEKYNLPRECIPTQFLNEAKVWEALLENMPMTALVRNLATMTRVGLLVPFSNATKKVVQQLGDADALKRARLHPIQMLSAHITYGNGRGARGQNTWSPVQQVVDALYAGFYTCFGNVPSTGKNILIGLDVSGSMTGGEIAGVPGLNPRQASAAMALVTMNVEPNYEVVGFTSGGWTNGPAKRNSWGMGMNSGLTPVNISPKMRIRDVIKTIDSMSMGGTDCALPYLYAEANNRDVDAVIIYTDNETWSGSIQPTQAKTKLQNKLGHPVKGIVVGMTSTGFSIADPLDPHAMDVVGFDSATPQLMSDFISGKF
jgi:60 kDa SS-A/Ro ribonucleoprotein